MTISQTITVYAGDVPNKDTMTADEFDTAANDWVEYWTNTVPAEINTWAGEANQTKTDVNNARDAALTAANYKGEWSGLTGTLDQPACVSHNSVYWMLQTYLEDVTTSEPSDSNADWKRLPDFENTVIATEVKQIKVVEESSYPATPEDNVLYILTPDSE